MSSTRMPWMKFWKSNWRGDHELAQCAPATRGVWLELCMAMHDRKSGTLTGTPEQLSRIARCSASEMEVAAKELIATEAADGGIGDGIVTLISRRITRETKKKKQTKDRVDKHRAKSRNASDIDPVTQDETRDERLGHGTDERRETKKTKEKVKTLLPLVGVVLPLVDLKPPRLPIEEIYAAYPRKEGKKQGLAKLTKSLRTPEAFARCLQAAKNYARRCSMQGTEAKYMKHFSTWVGCWEDYEGSPPSGNGGPATRPTQVEPGEHYAALPDYEDLAERLRTSGGDQ